MEATADKVKLQGVESRLEEEDSVAFRNRKQTEIKLDHQVNHILVLIVVAKDPLHIKSLNQKMPALLSRNNA